MDDVPGSDPLKALILAALNEADRQDETLVSCFLAQAIDAVERRSDETMPTEV